MPVEDTEVHELVKKTGHHEHCHNNRPPPTDGYWAQRRDYRLDGSYTMGDVFIKNTMSKLCRQPGAHPPLVGCIGCQHLGEDREYEERNRA